MMAPRAVACLLVLASSALAQTATKLSLAEPAAEKPLTSSQKLSMFATHSYHPYQFLWAGVTAGISQTDHENRGYGQGAEGFGKRYGAALADQASGQFFGTFLYPSLLHQDPRYFRMKNGPVGRRLTYAVSRIFVTRNDSGARAFNFSRALGSLSSAALANTYTPTTERGAEFTLTTAGMQMLSSAGFNVFHEFWPDVKRKLRKPKAAPGIP